MRFHHTKNKGDLGILHAQLDLATRGYGLLLPLTEHEAFDLVAYRDHRFFRVQVKYRAAVNGVVTVPFTTSWADRHGVHSTSVDKRFVDVLCIFCPDTGCCYYVDPSSYGGSVNLRITRPGNAQRKRIAWAADFTDLPASVRGVPAGSRPALEEKSDVRQSP